MNHQVGRYWSIALLIDVVLWTSAAMAQSPTTSPETAARALSDATKTTPITMTECEGRNNCATWTFLGLQGNGKSPSGEEADFTVQNSDSKDLVIQRSDSTGKSAGLTATYRGKRTGDRLVGEVTSSWPGHWEKQTSNWYATVEHLPVGLPPVMRFCGVVRCGTLNWSNGDYEMTWDGEVPNPGETFTVEMFKPEAVLIYRNNNWGKRPRPNPTVLTGRMSPQGNSVVDGHMSGTNQNGVLGIGSYQLSWGSALNEARIPGQPPQPQKQAVVVVQPAMVCFPWFFTLVCSN